MKIKLDENLPVRLVESLAALGHDVDTVSEEGLASRPDEDIWRAAQEAGRFLVTQDLDFSDARRYLPGIHHGVMLVRLHEPGREALFRRITAAFQCEDIIKWQSCLVVLTETKLRILPSSFRSAT